MARDAEDASIDPGVSISSRLVRADSSYRCFSLNLVIVRPGMVYGPYVDYGGKHVSSICARSVSNGFAQWLFGLWLSLRHTGTLSNQ